MRGKRARLIDTVSDQRMEAYLAGQQAAERDQTYDQARLHVLDYPDTYLTIGQRMAYAQLLPATWWSAFRNGFYSVEVDGKPNA